MPEIGGVPRLLWKLWLYKPEGHTLSVLSVCQQDPVSYEVFDQTTPLSIERVPPVHAAKLTSIRYFGRLLSMALKMRPDVILCGVAFPTAIIAGMVGRLLQIPIVVITHSEDLTIRGQVNKRLLRWALNSSQAVFALGAYGRHQLELLGVTRPPIEMAPPGIDPEPFLQTNQAAQPAEGFTLLTVARLIRRKGQDMVIRTLPRLSETIPGIRYVVVGSGPDEQALRSLAADLGVAERVQFLGTIPDEQLPAAYQACDLFVMLSRPSDDEQELEGFGIVFLEAGAAGKPVLGGRTGGVAGAVREGVTGYLIDPLDSDELTRRVEEFASQPALGKQMGEAGRGLVFEKFTAAIFSQKIYTVLEQVIQPGKRGPV